MALSGRMPSLAISTSAVAPPRGMAMDADSSTIRRPLRIGVATLGGFVDRLDALLNEARR